MRPLDPIRPWAATPSTQLGTAHAGFLSRLLGGRHLDPRAVTGLRAPMLMGVSVQVVGPRANAPAALGSRYTTRPIAGRVPRRNA